MTSEPNAQYNYARPDSLSVRIAAKMRERIFARFMQALHPTEEDMVLDIGVTADESYTSSNYFEALYPHKHRIVAAGIDDASFLERKHPGVQFRRADALAIPFPDESFDLIHASAVWEHVGSFENQGRMLSECLRVARRGVFLTTPNRWFPVEFHTQLPLVHWLPKPLFRSLIARTRYAAMADETHLNLMTPSEVWALAQRHPGWRFHVESTRLLGWPSNILMVAERG